MYLIDRWTGKYGDETSHTGASWGHSEVIERFDENSQKDCLCYLIIS